MNLIRISTLAAALAASAANAADFVSPWSLLRPFAPTPTTPGDPPIPVTPIRSHHSRTVVHRSTVDCTNVPPSPNFSGGIMCAETNSVPLCRFEHRTPVYDVRGNSNYVVAGETATCTLQDPKSDYVVNVTSLGIIYESDDSFAPGQKASFLSWNASFSVLDRIASGQPIYFGNGSVKTRSLTSSDLVLHLENMPPLTVPPGETHKTYDVFWGETEILGPM